MALRRIRRRRKASITSLIDVIFLLLLFFMLSSTFSKFSEVEIATAPAGQGMADDSPVHILTLTETGLILDDQPVRLDGLPARLDSLRPAAGGLSVSVDATEEATTQQLVDVLMVLHQVGGLDILVMEPA